MTLQNQLNMQIVTDPLLTLMTQYKMKPLQKKNIFVYQPPNPTFENTSFTKDNSFYEPIRKSHQNIFPDRARHPSQNDLLTPHTSHNRQTKTHRKL